MINRECNNIINQIESKVMGHIGLKEVYLLFGPKSEEFNFFINQIKHKGLSKFHISVSPNISFEEKRKCVKEVIRLWDAEKIEIKNL